MEAVEGELRCVSNEIEDVYESEEDVYESEEDNNKEISIKMAISSGTEQVRKEETVRQIEYTMQEPDCLYVVNELSSHWCWCWCCKDSGRLYYHVSQYNLHVKTHLNDKDLACDVCGMTFTHKHLLEKHKVLHKKER